MKKLKKIKMALAGLMSFAFTPIASGAMEPTLNKPIETKMTNDKSVERQVSEKLNWERIVMSNKSYKRKENILVWNNGQPVTCKNGNVTLHQIIIPDQYLDRIPIYIEKRENVCRPEDVLGGFALGSITAATLLTPLFMLADKNANRNR